MALQEKLDAMREMAKTRIPPEARAVMERSVADLRASGIMSRVAKGRAAGPGLHAAQCRRPACQPQGALARGPVVLSFYRGRW